MTLGVGGNLNMTIKSITMFWNAGLFCASIPLQPITVAHCLLRIPENVRRICRILIHELREQFSCEFCKNLISCGSSITTVFSVVSRARVLALGLLTVETPCLGFVFTPYVL